MARIATDCPSISSESLVNEDRLDGRVWGYIRGEYWARL